MRGLGKGKTRRIRDRSARRGARRNAAGGLSGISQQRSRNGLRSGHRSGNSRRAELCHENVLRLPQRYRRRTQPEHLPHLSVVPRRHPPVQHRGPGKIRIDGAGIELRASAAQRIRSESLLLPRPSQGIPAFPGPPAAGEKRLAGYHLRGRGNAAPPDPENSHGRGCGETHSRDGWTDAHQPGRFQPRRRPPDRDRDGTGHPKPPGGHGICPRPEDPDPLYRDLGMQPGGGQHAHRRQHFPTAPGNRPTQHQGRGQKHELHPARGGRHRSRNRTPGCRFGQGRGGRPAHAALGSGEKRNGRHAGEI